MEIPISEFVLNIKYGFIWKNFGKIDFFQILLINKTCTRISVTYLFLISSI